jgi:type I restriction enzyme S subunit
MTQQVVNIEPSSWRSTTLIELAKFIDYRGRTPKKTEDGIPLITAKNIRNGYIDRNPREFIALDAYDDWMTRGIPKVGDVLFTTEAPLGNVAVIDIEEKFALAQRAICFQFYESYVGMFVSYFLRSPQFQQILNGHSTGTTVKGIKAATLKKLDINIPPIAEQKRIVEKLDSLLAQVDTIQQRLNNLPNIIKRYRQSVLAAAVSGKLTEQWRKNNQCQKSTIEIKSEIKNYRYEIWIQEQEAKFQAKGKVPKNDKWKEKYKEVTTELNGNEKTLPKGWVYETLEGLIYISARIGWKGLKAEEYTEEGPLFLSVHGLNHGQHVDLSRAYHISEERYKESPEIQLKNEDILLCKDGAGIGKIAIIKDLTELASINSSLLLIRSGKYFLTDYLYYFLAGPEVQRIVQERMTGSAVPHLFQRDVKEFVLEVPPIEEQTEIVRLVEQHFALADTLEKNLKNAKQKVDNLTQSILAKAFRGELVPQDPNDEPAEQLLSRIKTARAEAELLEKAAKKVTSKTKRQKGVVS